MAEHDSPSDGQMQRLLDLLFFRFERDGTSLFALFDAARERGIHDRIRHSDFEHDCLFTGQLSADLLATSPYIVRIVPGSVTFSRLIEQGWGRSWGLFLASRAGLYDVRRHLRRLLQVRTEDHKRLFFRYYDPRVLRMFLPTCDPAQLAQVFGPIQRFDMETEDGAHLLRFRLIPEPSAPPTLRSWTYSLSESRDADDDRGR
jgi:hypothetical protein